MMAMIGAGLVFHLALYGPDRVGRFLPGIHVDHPAKDVGRKRSTGGFAFFFGGYGAGQTELGCPGEHLRLAALGGRHMFTCWCHCATLSGMRSLSCSWVNRTGAVYIAPINL